MNKRERKLVKALERTQDKLDEAEKNTTTFKVMWKAERHRRQEVERQLEETDARLDRATLALVKPWNPPEPLDEELVVDDDAPPSYEVIR